MTTGGRLASFDAFAGRWLEVVAHEVLYSTVLFCAVLALTAALRHRLPRLQYGLWWLVLLRLVLPPSLSSRWSLAWLLEGDPQPMISPETLLPIGPTEVALALEDVATSSFPWRSLLVLLHLAGALTVVAGLSRKLTTLSRGLRAAVPVPDRAVVDAVQRWSAMLGVRRPLRVVSSDASYPPLTFGVRHPIIHLPNAVLCNRDSILLESVVAHELAHVARNDYFWLRIQNLIQAAFFFHPVVWLTTSRIDEERERICDEVVLATGLIPRQGYADGLLTVVGLGLGQMSQVPVFSNPHRRLSMRIRHILCSRVGTQRSRLFSGVLAVVAGAILLPMASAPHLSRAADGASVRALSSPLPVGWITSPFGNRINPLTAATEHHEGVDIGAPEGQWLVAPTDGLVTVATSTYVPSPHLGTVLRIDHGGGLETFYAHLGEIGVTVGQRVHQGDRLAQVGNTGLSTGAHVHFEIRQDGVAVDPAEAVAEWSRSAAGRAARVAPTKVNLAGTLHIGARVENVRITVLTGEDATIDALASADDEGFSIAVTPEVLPTGAGDGEPLIELSLRIWRVVSGTRTLVSAPTLRALPGSEVSVATSGAKDGEGLRLTVIPTL